MWFMCVACVCDITWKQQQHNLHQRKKHKWMKSVFFFLCTIQTVRQCLFLTQVTWEYLLSPSQNSFPTLMLRGEKNRDETLIINKSDFLSKRRSLLRSDAVLCCLREITGHGCNRWGDRQLEQLLVSWKFKLSLCLCYGVHNSKMKMSSVKWTEVWVSWLICRFKWPWIPNCSDALN